MKFDITKINKMFKHIVSQKQNYSSEKIGSPKTNDPDTVVLDKNKSTPS